MAAAAIAAPPTFSGSGSPEPARIDLQTLLTMPLTSACAEIAKQPPAALERLRTGLWDILGTLGRKDEFLALQRILASKIDLTPENLATAPLPLGKILVAVRTGIQAFLHPSVQMSQQHLAEIFAQKRCKNMACQSTLPVGDCACNMCSRGGFCNLCMCVVCKKFDFETNTCRWIGCDFCLHWCHAECAMHMAHIRTVSVTSQRAGSGPRGTASEGSPGLGEDTAFCCPSCGHCSDLIGFVRDVFEMCADQWDAKGTKAELECVRMMLGGSSNPRGVQLLRFASKVLLELDQGADYRTVRQDFKSFLAKELARSPMVPSPAPVSNAGTSTNLSGSQSPSPVHVGAGGKHTPSGGGYTGAGPFSSGGTTDVEARGAPAAGSAQRLSHGSLRIPAEVEAMRARRRLDAGGAQDGAVPGSGSSKADVIFLDEDGARAPLAECDAELERKRRELGALEEERKRREYQLEELQNVADSREADAKRLEAEAEEARKEVQVLQHIIDVKRRTMEREFEAKRASLALEETESKRRRILEELDRMQSRPGRPGSHTARSPTLEAAS